MQQNKFIFTLYDVIIVITAILSLAMNQKREEKV